MHSCDPCTCASSSHSCEIVKDMAHSTGESNRDNWIVIGISGVTCGGKTSLARQLQAALPRARVLHQDRYFHADDDPRHVRCDGLAHNNYDVLSALDMPALHRDVLRALSGDADTDTDTGAGAGAGKSFLVVEGFTVLNYEPIMELCDLRYYLTLERGECAARRALRLYEPPDVAGYFERVVWPEHLRYRAQIEKDKRVKFLDGAQPDAFDIVMADIRKLTA